MRTRRQRVNFLLRMKAELQSEIAEYTTARTADHAEIDAMAKAADALRDAVDVLYPIRQRREA